MSDVTCSHRGHELCECFSRAERDEHVWRYVEWLGAYACMKCSRLSLDDEDGAA